ncbi:hypothetical protein ABW20_dc0110412 [Dactylellina cionopaga]|nr:hypothetical protein ABW20_dc0110412 [Dactylellina cionopaga]
MQPELLVNTGPTISIAYSSIEAVVSDNESAKTKNAETSKSLFGTTLTCTPIYRLCPLSPPSSPVGQSAHIQLNPSEPSPPTGLPTPPPSPQCSTDDKDALENIGNTPGSLISASAAAGILNEDEKLVKQQERREHQKAVFLRNAKTLRRKHYDRIARGKIAKYITLSYTWGCPLDFEAWLPAPLETIKFEKKQVPPVLERWGVAIRHPSDGTPIQKLHDGTLVEVLKLLDFPSTQNLRLVSKRFNDVYEDNWEDICDAILARHRNIKYIPDFLVPAGSIEEDSELKLRQHYYSISWIVELVLASFRKLADAYDQTLVNDRLYTELYPQSPSKKSPQPKILKGTTYPFPHLMEFLLEKYLEGPRRSKESLLRCWKALPLLDREVAMSEKERQWATSWVMELIRWYLEGDRMVFFAISDVMAGEEDEDILVSENDYCENLKSLRPAQLWELVRLVGIEPETIFGILKSRGFLQDEAEEMDCKQDGIDVKEEFVRARVHQILKGGQR